MNPDIPAAVSVTFMLTAFLTVGVFLYAVKSTRKENAAVKITLFFVPFWMMFQAILGIGGFHQVTGVVPPRIFAFGVLPCFGLIVLAFIFARSSLIEFLPLKLLTILHIIRIPVEIVLYWLFEAGTIPVEMTFEGRNFDILSGITALVVYLIAFRGGGVNRPLLITWNLLALGLLANIVITAILAFDSPWQQIAFDQPNRGVTYFPFVWLPSVIVPIVLFSHLASLYKLLTNKVS
jgi:hypothetical protein